MPQDIITTAVGTGEKGFAGDGGPAQAALLNGPFDVAFDGAGNLYFSDTFNNRIRRVDATSGTIITVAATIVAGTATPSSSIPNRSPNRSNCSGASLRWILFAITRLNSGSSTDRRPASVALGCLRNWRNSPPMSR